MQVKKNEFIQRAIQVAVYKASPLRPINGDLANNVKYANNSEPALLAFAN